MPETRVNPDPILASLKETDRLINERMKQKLNENDGLSLQALLRAKYHIGEAEIQIMEIKTS